MYLHFALAIIGMQHWLLLKMCMCHSKSDKRLKLRETPIFDVIRIQYENLKRQAIGFSFIIF